jgi:hypothetical protein
MYVLSSLFHFIDTSRTPSEASDLHITPRVDKSIVIHRANVLTRIVLFRVPAYEKLGSSPRYFGYKVKSLNPEQQKLPNKHVTLKRR